MGDLNSTAKEGPITALKDDGYLDLVNRFEGLDAYSYVFDGQWGYLDHALASGSLQSQITGTTTWHINSDEPAALDYNTDLSRPDKWRVSTRPTRTGPLTTTRCWSGWTCRSARAWSTAG